MQRLVNWDPQDPNALSEVIGELYQGYGQYQLSELQKYPRLHSLYKDLTDSGVIRPEHIEVLVVPSDQKVRQHSRYRMSRLTYTATYELKFIFSVTLSSTHIHKLLWHSDKWQNTAKMCTATFS